MFRNLLKAFFYIANRDRIPPLPRGILASEYDSMSAEERRVIARFGARDPNGVKVAMRQHGAKTVEELVAALEHHQAQRRIGERIRNGIARLTRSTPYDPHAQDIRRAKRKPDPRRIEIEQRARRGAKRFQEKD